MAQQGAEGAPLTENLRDESVTIEYLLRLAQGTSNLEKLKKILDEADRRLVDTVGLKFNPKDVRTSPEYIEIVTSTRDDISDLYRKANPNYREPGQPLKIVL